MRSRELDLKWKREHPEKTKESYRKYYLKNRDKKLAQGKIRYEKTKELKKWQTIERKYKITKEDFNNMLESQGGKCAICGDENINQWTLNIDHCHKTGKIRGILCNLCNTALGSFKEDISLIKNAINYLNKHSAVEM